MIKRDGKTFSSRTLDDSEFINELKKKSFEKLEEYINTKTNEEALEELADLLEIIHVLAVYHGASIEKVEEIRSKKAKERGALEKKSF